MTDREKESMCPSSYAHEGSVLLGIVYGERVLGYVTPQVTADAELLDEVGDRPEEGYRFASPCVRGACHNWTGERCGLIHRVLESDLAPADGESRDLPLCSIRARCRWFAQAGPSACSVCPLMRTPPPPARAA